MRFANPEMLWLLLLLPVLAGLAGWRLRAGDAQLRRAMSEPMAARLTSHLVRGRLRWTLFLMILAMGLVILGGARPQRGTQYITAAREGIDVIVALDVSESMLAEDLKPSRLLRARHEIAGIIDRLRGDRIGLVAFAGAAFVQCPLTLDYAAARMFLEYMGPDLIPEPGTSLAEAISVACRAFESEGDEFKALILISDGEDHVGDLEKAVRAARQQGVRIFSVGIGSESGEPIPLRDGAGAVTGYKRDQEGKIVMTRLNEAPLRQAAEDTRGLYVRAGGTLGLDRIMSEIERMEKKELSGGVRVLYEDRYSYFVWPAAILLLGLWFLPGRRPGGVPGRASRRPAAVSLLLAGFLLLAGTVPQAGSQGMPQGGSQGRPQGGSQGMPQGGSQGMPQGGSLAMPPGGAQLPPGGAQLPPGSPRDEMLDEEQWNELLARNEVYRAEHPEDPRPFFNLGNLYHLKGDFEDATEFYDVAAGRSDAALSARVAYNRGNTLYKMGRLAEARDAFAQAIVHDPAFENAKINLELTQRMLDQMEAQPDSSAQQNQPQSGDQQQDQQDQQDQQNQQDPSEEQERGENDRHDQDDQEEQPRPDAEQDGSEQPPPGEQQDSEEEDPDERSDSADGAEQEAEADSVPPLTDPQLLQLLKALEASEKDLLKTRFQARSRNEKVLKDW